MGLSWTSIVSSAMLIGYATLRQEMCMASAAETSFISFMFIG